MGKKGVKMAVNPIAFFAHLYYLYSTTKIKSESYDKKD